MVPSDDRPGDAGLTLEWASILPPLAFPIWLVTGEDGTLVAALVVLGALLGVVHAFRFCLALFSGMPRTALRAAAAALLAASPILVFFGLVCSGSRPVTMNDTSTVARILRDYRRVAVVGISDRPERDSHRVAAYLQRAGYTIIPVNPNVDHVLGERCWPSLDDAPGPIEVVDVFRRSELVEPVVDAAIRVGAKAVWMQDGVVNEAAAAKARAAGLLVVMDRCMLRDHARGLAG